MSTPESLTLIAPRMLDLIETGLGCIPTTLLCCEGGSEVALAADRLRAPATSLEDRIRERRRWTNVDVGRLAALLDSPAGSVVLPYAADPEVEARARHLGISVAAIPAELKRQVDDKMWLRGVLRDSGVRVPSSVALGARREPGLFDRLARRFGVPFVLQPRRGSGGEHTWLVETLEQLHAKLESERRADWLAAEFVGRTTINIHGVIHDTGVDVSSPSLQLTGINELTSGWGAYCGSDAGAISDQSDEVREAIGPLTRRVAALLASFGYRGVFGVDFAVGANDGKVTVLEVNPRFQASTWLLAAMEASRGVPTIVSRHLAALGFASRMQPFAASPSSVSGAFLAVFAESDRRRSASVDAGVYILDGPENPEPTLRFLRPGAFTDCIYSEVYVGGAPSTDIEVAEGASLVRVATRQALANSDGRSLTTFGGRLADAARRLVTPSLEDDRGHTS